MSSQSRSPSKKHGRLRRGAPLSDGNTPAPCGSEAPVEEHSQMVVVIDESGGANSNEQVFTIVNNGEIDNDNETTVMVVSVDQPGDEIITQDDENMAQDDENIAQDDENLAQEDNIIEEDDNEGENEENEAQNVDEDAQDVNTSKVDITVVSQEESFQCSVCQKSVQGQMDFFVHLKSHYEPKPAVKKPGPKKAQELSVTKVDLKKSPFGQLEKKPRGRKRKSESANNSKTQSLGDDSKWTVEFSAPTDFNPEKTTRSGRVSKPRPRDADMVPLTSSRVKIEPKTEPEEYYDDSQEFDDHDEEYIGVDVEMHETSHERVELGDIEAYEDDDEIVVREKPKQKRQQNLDIVKPRKPRKNASDVKKVQEYENGPVKFECSICKKLFANTTSLAVHHRIHKEHGYEYTKFVNLQTDEHLDFGEPEWTVEIELVSQHPFTKNQTFKPIHLEKYEPLKQEPIAMNDDDSDEVANEDDVAQNSYTKNVSVNDIAVVKPKPTPGHPIEWIPKKLRKNTPNVRRVQEYENGPVKYECNICNKLFGNTTSLAVHHRIHRGEKPFKCKECGNCFRQHSDMYYHYVSVHSGIKAYQCEFCGKEFARKYSLTIHHKIHTGVKDYVCDICHLGFRAASYLLEHKRAHSGEKPFLCDLCGKGFRVKCSMKRHRRKVHFKGQKGLDPLTYHDNDDDDDAMGEEEEEEEEEETIILEERYEEAHEVIEQQVEVVPAQQIMHRLVFVSDKEVILL